MGTEGAAPGDDYDVFLSFSGKDTRNRFTSCLFQFLIAKGVKTFIDDRDLPSGQPLATSLPKAIRESRIWIVIFSTNYACSEWCLNELAEMVECSSSSKDKEIIPIFYDVTPSDVKDQEGTFRKAFAKHKKRKLSKETLKKWRAALKHVGGLSGLERSKIASGNEGELVARIADKVLEKLRKYDLSMPPYLVGIEHHVKEMEKLLNNSDNKSMMVGIYGMCGIGKTTISKAVYNKLWKDYDCHCFLEDIGRKIQGGGVYRLQKQLLMGGLHYTRDQIPKSNLEALIRKGFEKKKVLIVLDNVEKLEELIVECEWLGPGSRIIVTTRNKGILGEAPCYETPLMDEEQAIELFTKCASVNISEELRDIPKKVADIASGLPLSLTKMGEHFRRFQPVFWDANCRKLENKPVKEVKDHLEGIYAELDQGQRKIFLDIACLLIGVDQRIACHMWEANKLYPEIDLEELKLRFSLVKIKNDNDLDMHRQLRDFGRDVVRDGLERVVLPDDSAKGSRLWSHDEALKTLTSNSGQVNYTVLALCLGFPSRDGEQSLEVAAFMNLQNLYFLRLDSAKLGEIDNTESPFCDLKWLCWKVPSPKLPLSIFRLDELVILDLSNSSISNDWEGWPQLMEKAEKLKVLNLTGCAGLNETPNLSAFKDLERLILEGCTSLVEIPASRGSLGNLIYLNTKNCEKLNFQSEVFGSVETLEEIIMDGTTIEELPNWSKGCRKTLRVLSAIGCKNLKGIGSISGIRPPREELGSVEALEKIILDGTAVEELPEWSEGCKEKLRVLSAIGCKKLRKIDSIAELKSLTDVAFDDTPITDLPKSLGSLLKLVNLSLNRCNQLKKLPHWIGSLKELRCFSLVGCQLLKASLDLSKLTKLKTPMIDGSPGVHIILCDKEITNVNPERPDHAYSVQSRRRRSWMKKWLMGGWREGEERPCV